MITILNFLKAVFTHKRAYSFYWRALDMAIAELAFIIPSVLEMFTAPQWLIMGVGLILGEVTKQLNKKSSTDN